MSIFAHYSMRYQCDIKRWEIALQYDLSDRLADTESEYMKDKNDIRKSNIGK